MIAVWALVAFIGTIIAWNALLKRNIGESMIAGFVVVGVFAVIGDGFHGPGPPSPKASWTPCRRRSPSPAWPSSS